MNFEGKFSSGGMKADHTFLIRITCVGNPIPTSLFFFFKTVKESRISLLVHKTKVKKGAPEKYFVSERLFQKVREKEIISISSHDIN